MLTSIVLLFCGVQAWGALPWPALAPAATIEVPVTAEVREPTDAEKDAAYLKEHHWRLGPSSCGMLGCKSHPGTWELTPGPEPKPKSTTSSTCPGGNCRVKWRLFRRW